MKPIQFFEAFAHNDQLTNQTISDYQWNSQRHNHTPLQPAAAPVQTSYHQVPRDGATVFASSPLEKFTVWFPLQKTFVQKHWFTLNLDIWTDFGGYASIFFAVTKGVKPK